MPSKLPEIERPVPETQSEGEVIEAQSTWQPVERTALATRSAAARRSARGMQTSPTQYSIRAMTAPFQIFDPLLAPAEADAMLRLCERFGSYRTYAEDVTADEPFAPEIPQRYDAARNFVRTGGRFGRREDARGARGAHQLLPRDLRLRPPA